MHESCMSKVDERLESLKLSKGRQSGRGYSSRAGESDEEESMVSWMVPKQNTGKVSHAQEKAGDLKVNRVTTWWEYGSSRVTKLGIWQRHESWKMLQTNRNNFYGWFTELLRMFKKLTHFQKKKKKKVYTWCHSDT